MPFSFPSAPTVGQQSTQNGRSYSWTGSAWELVAGDGSGPAPADSLLRGLFIPPAPTSLTATAGNAQATLSWSAPSVIAQAPITDYVVQFSSNSGSTWTTFADGTSTATSATVTGLTNGTAYVFRVAAVNAVGTGAYSGTATGTPIGGTVPGTPTSLSATGGNAQVALSWTAPADNGGTAITDYAVQFSSDSGSTWSTFADGTSTTTSATVTGLTNGTAYVFRVAATNSAGTGAYTAASSSVTPSAVSLTVSPSSGTADGGTAYSWSGSGTAADPLQTSDAAAPNGIDWGFGYGANTYRVWQFTCGVSGTLTFEFGGRENEGPEIPNMLRYVRNGTLSTTFVGSQTFFGTFFGTYGARRTISVTAGDVIKLSAATGSGSQSSLDWWSSYLPQGKFRLWIS